jgi:uncharacterized protein (TIGR02145 family)
MINSLGGTIRNTSMPIGTTWTYVNDPCPAGWRIPTESELLSLLRSGNAWTTRNGVFGRLFGTTPNQIFLPAAGLRYGSGDYYGNLDRVSILGVYWSSVRRDALIRILYFRSDGTIGVHGDWADFGRSVRCVMR